MDNNILIRHLNELNILIIYKSRNQLIICIMNIIKYKRESNYDLNFKTQPNLFGTQEKDNIVTYFFYG